MCTTGSVAYELPNGSEEGARMKFPRRKFLQLAAGAVALPGLARTAAAQAYPSRAVHIVVGFPAGQTADIAARLIGQWLSERLGQPVVIDNRPGAASNTATEYVVHAPPDGYTLLSVNSSNLINQTLYEKLPYDFLRDIVPVAGFLRVPLVMEVNPAFPAKTVPEFIAYAKANPGKINMATGGTGNSTHVTGELFKMMTGVNLLVVPYRGSPPAITDLLAGQVQVMFDVLSSSLEYIRAGKLRALGVTTAARADALPSVPTVGEFVTGYEASAIGGLGAPKGTPVEIIDRLNREINAGLGDPTIKARFADLGLTPLSRSQPEFAKLVNDETEKWGKVVKFAGLRAE
jgi:tripartite-type tricarboxylate transporter receptor subunit TctC